MKLDRDKVIQRLEARIKDLQRDDEKEAALRITKHKQAVRAFNRIHVTEDSTYDQVTRARNLLSEVHRYMPVNGSNHNKTYVVKQIEREISLLKLSADDFVSVRTNSSLADYLT